MPKTTSEENLVQTKKTRPRMIVGWIRKPLRKKSDTKQ